MNQLLGAAPELRAKELREGGLVSGGVTATSSVKLGAAEEGGD